MYLIDKKYSITSNSKSIIIDGNERESLLTFDDILAERIAYDINKSHVQINDSYVGVNWRKEISDVDYDKLAAHALLITLDWKYSDPLFDLEDGDDIYQTMWAYQDGYASRQAYKKYENVRDFVGHFRDQIYPYGVQYILEGNIETPVFPVKGSIDGVPNDLGLYKFPTWGAASINSKTLGIEFDLGSDTSGARKYWLDNQGSFTKIIGMRFVRADRIDNLIGQGMVVQGYDRCYCALTPNGGDGGFYGGSGYDPDTAYTAPLFKGYFPAAELGNNDEVWYHRAMDDNYSIETIYYRSGVSENKYGLFIPDLFFKSVDVPSVSYLQIAKKHSPVNYDYTMTGSPIRPMVIGGDFKTGSAIPASNSDCYEVSTDLIEKGTKKGKNRFTSFMPGKSWNLDGYHYNRSMLFNTYVGVEDKSTGHDLVAWGAAYSIANLYKLNNNTDFFNSVVNQFTIVDTNYHAISEVKQMNESSVTLCFKGDCFLQKTFFRQCRFYGYDNANEKNPTAYSGDGSAYVGQNNIWYQWGMLFGIVTENVCNTEMRNEVITRDQDEQETVLTFFPRCLREFEDIDQWVVLRNNAVHEALQINQGYNKMASDKVREGYDVDMPDYLEDHKPNRSYISGKHVAGAFIDSYREIDPGSYKDYSPERGPITSAVEYRNFLLIVYDQAIQQHYVDQYLTKTSEAGETILGRSIERLSERFRLLATFGSQHKWSIVKTDNMVYGTDWRRRIIWQASRERSPEGVYYLAARDLLKSKKVQSEFYNFCDLYDKFADKLNIVSDTPLLGSGIVAGYDNANDEVLFTFLFSKDGVRYDRTFVYSELLKAFTGNSPAVAPMYISLNKDMFSVGSQVGGSSYAVTNKVYLHNHPDAVPQQFYGVNYPMILSFIVNGITDKGSMATMEKIFDSLQIEMTHEDLKTIIYETQQQEGVYTFKTEATHPNEPWEHSEYEEDKWAVPVMVQTSVVEDEFEKDSVIRGRWLKITLTYEPTEAKRIYIRNVISEFQLSYT